MTYKASKDQANLGRGEAQSTSFHGRSIKQGEKSREGDVKEGECTVVGNGDDDRPCQDISNEGFWECPRPLFQ